MEENIIQDYTYYKYYLKIKFFIFKNKVHPYKKKKLWMNQKTL